MSSGSHGSSASSRFRSGGTSPIPYRVHPMDYEPSVNCYYGRKAPLLTSWTDANPGRRYLCCSRATQGCGFWRWFDPRASPYLRQLLLDLRSKIVRMEGENALLHMSLEQALCKARHQQSFSSRLVAFLLMVILFFICVSAWSGVPSA
ncbi:uncharacterized protein [Triticum aestivum]|uniref:uncharacterized protein isoform X1 n=1 Tax=Triticum aestivum TaxID=4565 RepID=UPI0008432EE7|nr:uncharacterized protein LOC123185148 isoform X1 [Triticum aestivum]